MCTSECVLKHSKTYYNHVSVMIQNIFVWTFTFKIVLKNFCVVFSISSKVLYVHSLKALENELKSILMMTGVLKLSNKL